jgi:hypothetical protein
MRRAALACLLLASACSGREVAVRVTIPNLEGVETPIPNLVLTFLPYDRDSVIQSLEARASSPRPNTAELDSLFHRFRQPFSAFLALSAADERLRRTRDSLVATGQSAQEAPAGSPLAIVRDSLAEIAPALGRARAALDQARATLWPVMDSLRSQVRRWENTAFQGYDTLVAGLPGRRMGNPVADTTDAGGWATIELTDGAWWVTARSIDAGDPNAEWYWNVRITSDTVSLNPRTGRNRPRY